MNWKARGKYIVSFTVNLIVVLLIGFYGGGWFWRGFLSDVFIVVFLFSFLKMLMPASTLKVSLSVLAFSYLVEISQYFNLVELLGVNNKAIRILIGTHFDWLDLIAYTVGFFICLFVGMKSQDDVVFDNELKERK
ncbi:ribosomal maturation YjgA family protein [Aeromonas jandaei]|uniref:ribosomal maturation YjgA family protein n=1 Tax=Aeromonas jandaei TaxID=650 RepID=UPI0038D1A0DB